MSSFGGSSESQYRISGPRECGNNNNNGGGSGNNSGGGNNGGGGNRKPKATRLMPDAHEHITFAECTTVSGGTANAPCVFPFTYRGVRYNGCILVDAGDGKPWCSVLVDENGNHVGGQGKWGHCPQGCPNDLSKHA